MSKQFINGRQSRTNDYRADRNLSDPVGRRDYKGTGFDRGHLVPAGDMKLSRTSMSETFFMTNMSPQRPAFNQGAWNSFENKVRKWVKAIGPAHIITAPVLQLGLPQIRSGISIPEYYFKAIYFPQEQVMLAFLFPNQKIRNMRLADFQVTVDDLETQLGWDFFAGLENSLENQLEAELAPIP